MVNQYALLMEKQQQRVNELPLFFAFTDKRFNEIVTAAGLNPHDPDIYDEFYSLGSGCFYFRKDAETVRNCFRLNHAETEAAIQEDTTGSGFVKDMFKYELKNHEFGYDPDLYDTLNALGYTTKEIKEDTKLYNGLKLAAEEILRKEEYENPELRFKRVFEYAVEQGY